MGDSSSNKCYILLARPNGSICAFWIYSGEEVGTLPGSLHSVPAETR